MPLSLRDLGQKPVGSFRAATLDDAALLYAWRVEAESAAWYEGEPTSFADHLVWLEARIGNPLVHVLIWGDDEGLVRIESNGELSFWGGTPGMLEAATIYAESYGGRLKVTLDQNDIGAAAVLRNAGFVPYPATSLTYTV